MVKDNSDISWIYSKINFHLWHCVAVRHIADSHLTLVLHLKHFSSQICVGVGWVMDTTNKIRFLAVQDSSIGDIVSQSVTQSLSHSVCPKKL